MTLRDLNILLATLLPLSFAVAISEISAAPDAGAAFRGHDDRVILDSGAPPLSAIGRLNLGAGRQFCTGTLVAPDRVITAAHCLIDSRTKKPYRPNQVHFVAGQRRDQFVDHARARCLLPLRRNQADGTPDIARHTDDAAVIVLDRPLNVPPAKLAKAYIADPGPLRHPAYFKSRPYLLSVHDSCSLLHKSKGMWFTDCDTSYGSSGGPVFSSARTKPRLIAIMSGTTRANDQVFSIAVPITMWGKLARNAKCGAGNPELE